MNILKKMIIISYDSFDYFIHRIIIKWHFYLNLLRKVLYLRNNVKSILVIRMSSIGDVVRTTVVIKKLRMKYPHARIDFLTTAAVLPVINTNKSVNSIYTLKDLDSLPQYDWVINLQRLEPPQSFLRDSTLPFDEMLRYISTRVRYRLITGRHYKNNKDVIHVNIFYCKTEFEELFMNALLPCSYNGKVDTAIDLDGDQSEIMEKFGLSEKKDYLALFLGTHAVGGDDHGFRTYSIDFLEALVEMFEDQFAIIVIGQSDVKTQSELRQYKELLAKHPDIISLVDQTTLQELLHVINASTLLISCDSGPLHIGMALQVPVIGLFVNSASFRISPVYHGENYVLINSSNPCLEYNWRWKFHCLTCREHHAAMYGCELKKIARKVDSIALDEVRNAATKLLTG